MSTLARAQLGAYFSVHTLRPLVVSLLHTARSPESSKLVSGVDITDLIRRFRAMKPAGGSMAKVTLTRMDVVALLKLRRDIDSQLSARRQQLEKQLSRLGPGQRLRGPASSLKGRKAPIKYRDKSGNVWAGRGAQPRWLTAAIKSGAKRDDFLVDRSARKAPKKKTRKVKRRRSKR